MERLVENFQNTFYPFKNISIDEMVIGFLLACFSARQYNPQKPSKHHIKTFGLCDSATGYCFNLFVYFGADTTWHPGHDPGAQQAEKVVQKLTQPLRTQKHHIFADRLYTSIPYARTWKKLRALRVKTKCTKDIGTVIKILISKHTDNMSIKRKATLTAKRGMFQ